MGDPLWEELHDLERRVGRIEGTLLKQAAAEQERQQELAARRDRFRWVLPVIVSVLGTAAIVLETLSALHLI